MFGICPYLSGNDACLYLWAMKFKEKQNPWDFRLAVPCKDLCGHLSASRRSFCISSASLRSEELGDSVWLPRSFTVLHASSGFYFGTHKGQSQPLPAGMAKCVPGAAGFPSLLGPTNQEARTSNLSSTGVDINIGSESRGTSLYRIPNEPRVEKNTPSHSSLYSSSTSPFSYSLNQ